MLAQAVLEDEPHTERDISAVAPAFENNANPRPPKRSREAAVDLDIVPTVGKSRKGEDFWSQIDGLFAQGVQERGSSLKSTAWGE